MNETIQDKLMEFSDTIEELTNNLKSISSEIDSFGYEEEQRYYNIKPDDRSSDKALILLDYKKGLQKIASTIEAANSMLLYSKSMIDEKISQSLEQDFFDEDEEDEDFHGVIEQNSSISEFLDSIKLDDSEEPDYYENEVLCNIQAKKELDSIGIVEPTNTSVLICYLIENPCILAFFRDHYPSEYKYITRRYNINDFKNLDNFRNFVQDDLMRIYLQSNTRAKERKYLSIFFNNPNNVVRRIYKYLYESARNYYAKDVNEFLGDEAMHYYEDNIKLIDKKIKYYTD